MKDKLILLVGASGSGKTTITKELEKEGYNIIQSYTTREPRYENEWGHVFIGLNKWNEVILGDGLQGFDYTHTGKPTEFDFISVDDMIAYKKLYGEHYFATKEQYQGKGTSIYVVDPDGAEQVKENVEDAEVITIFLQVDRNKRMNRLRSRFYKVNNIENFIALKENEHLVKGFRKELGVRMNSDFNIFKVVKCDYVVDANREIEVVLKDVVEIMGKGGGLMCEHCEGENKDVYRHSKDHGHNEDLYVYLNENQIVHEIYADLDMYSSVLSVKINYCPMCGRKL